MRSVQLYAGDTDASSVKVVHRSHRCLLSHLARRGVIPNPVVGAITMIAIGILLNILGLGIFCRALFGLASNALPTFFGLTVGL